MNVKLRSVVPSDESFLVKLYGTTREWEKEYAGLDAAQWNTFITSQYAARKHHYDNFFGDAENSIVLYDGKPVGRHMVLRGKKEYRLVLTELLPECQGKGIGSKLVKDVLAEAEEVGKPVCLQVAKMNGPLALCQKLGFVKVGSNDMFHQLEWHPAALSGDVADNISVKEGSESESES